MSFALSEKAETGTKRHNDNTSRVARLTKANPQYRWKYRHQTMKKMMGKVLVIREFKN